MPIRIENKSTQKLSPKIIQNIERVLNFVPTSHVRGIERLRIVDKISDPRLNQEVRNSQPGLYHPKQGSQPAWIELAIGILVPNSSPFFKRMFQRFALKGNLATVLFSLIGQHYLITQRHSLKKNQLEGAIRSYTQGQLKSWVASENRFRTRLFKPIQPTLERWSRSLQQRAKRLDNRK